MSLVAAVAGGHILFQDVPGVGKTTLASSLAQALGGSFSRIQFTSDLLPGDVTGVSVLDTRSGDFTFRSGPLFANVVLADELNRTTPKTQSALFEAMEEGAVTVDGTTHTLPDAFMVIATQNPFDYHGTFALPDSQLDRFLMRLSIGYPGREAERSVLRQGGRERRVVESIATPDDLLALRNKASQVSVAEEVEDYMLDLVRATRDDARFLRGASPRGAQALLRASQARALVQRRDYVLPEDVRQLAVPVLAHRVLARGGGVGTDGGDDAIRSLLDELNAPI